MLLTHRVYRQERASVTPTSVFQTPISIITRETCHDKRQDLVRYRCELIVHINLYGDCSYY